MRYGVRFIDIGRMGHSDKATRASPRYRDGDEEDRASGGEILTSAPALSERRHRRFACQLVTVARRASATFSDGRDSSVPPRESLKT